MPWSDEAPRRSLEVGADDPDVQARIRRGIRAERIRVAPAPGGGIRILPAPPGEQARGARHRTRRVVLAEDERAAGRHILGGAE